MPENESATSVYDLPEEFLRVLPSDPFEQLDVARKITSIALLTRVSVLQSLSSEFRAKLAEKDQRIAELHSQIESLDASISDSSARLARAGDEKESLLRENAQLSNTVKELNRNVSKLEVFRKTLMQSLQEGEESSAKIQQVNTKPTPIDKDAYFSPSSSRSSSMRRNFSEIGNSVSEDRTTVASRPNLSHGFHLASQTSTPLLTPAGSPPSLSAAVTPSRTPKSVSPRRHSIALAPSRGRFDDRYSVFSSMPSNQYSPTSTSNTGSQTGQTRVDGKEFFRQVRSRLSYEQFGAFLTNVKDLNSRKKTRQDALLKADEIFGPDNNDLYIIFQGLITRNAQ